MNTVKVAFRNGGVEKFNNIKSVDTDICYGMYQLTHMGGGQTHIQSEVIQYIQFGKHVLIYVN